MNAQSNKKTALFAPSTQNHNLIVSGTCTDYGANHANPDSSAGNANHVNLVSSATANPGLAATMQHPTRRKSPAALVASLMLAAAMAPIGLAATAPAALADTTFDVTDTSTSQTWSSAHAVQKDITLTASGTETRVDVMAVTLDWTNAAFTYNRGSSTKTWDPATHSWKWTDSTAAWTKSTGSVGISNHSSVAVKVSLETPVTAHGWTVSQSGEDALVASAYDGNDEAAGTVKTGTLGLVASGIPTSGGTLTNQVTLDIFPVVPD